MISGKAGRFYVQIDYAGNATQARVIDSKTGATEDVPFQDEAFTYQDKLEQVLDAILEPSPSEADELRLELVKAQQKLAFMESNNLLSAEKWNQYQAL